VAFTGQVDIHRQDVKTISLWDGITSTVGGGGATAADYFYNVGGIGALQKLTITFEAVAASGTPTATVFWKGATAVDQEFTLTHTFWTGLATSTTIKTYIYLGHRDGTKVTDGAATAAESLYMYDVPYIAFGWNNTGGTDITGTLSVQAELI
jgi:hypothetical protein